jgi:hypothetical protein
MSVLPLFGIAVVPPVSHGETRRKPGTSAALRVALLCAVILSIMAVSQLNAQDACPATLTPAQLLQPLPSRGHH